MQVRAYRRRIYVILSVAVIDFPLWIELRHQEWVGAGVITFLMFAVTAHRMAQIGWDRIWAVPYCCVALSPFSMLVLLPTLDPWVSLYCVAALHLPVMVWPSGNRQTPDGSGS